jgi:hypothetical protein
MSTYTDEQLIDLLGVVGISEYKAAPEWSLPKLDAWIARLRDLSDGEFYDVAQSAIYESALCNRFRGNYEHVHCMATACYHESERRHQLAGHSKDCHGPTLYHRAHSDLMRDHGYTPSPDGVCVCGSGLSGHGVESADGVGGEQRG